MQATKRNNLWIIAGAIFLILLFFGLSSAAVIVSREGWDGLFDRKRDAVQKVMPEALPIVDKVEEEVNPEKH
jgi:TRAP-type C4-dicarboxylate transport system substrate-binding protein